MAIAEEDCCKTAFWGHDGLYEWVVMPFGLKNAPAFFQRLMDKTLRAERAFSRAYIDDVIIHSPDNFDTHLATCGLSSRAYARKQIKCHPKKMRLAERTVAYLGHNVFLTAQRHRKPRSRPSLRCRPLLTNRSSNRSWVPRVIIAVTYSTFHASRTL